VDPALHFLDHRARAFDHEQDVVALAVPAHHVGEALLAPLLDLGDAGALLLHEALHLIGEGVHFRLREVRIGDEKDLVRTVAHDRSFWIPGPLAAPRFAPLRARWALTGSKGF
jgi:hypothetical protein